MSEQQKTDREIGRGGIGREGRWGGEGMEQCDMEMGKVGCRVLGLVLAF